MRGKRTVHRLRSRGKLGAARLSEELEALRQFQAVTFGLTSETEIRTLLDRILAAAMEITEADFGNISLPDPVTGDLQIAVQRRFDAEFVDYFNSLPLERGACGKAFAAGQRVIVEDVATDPLFDDESGEVLRNAKVRAVQSTPLTGFSGKVVGVISTHYRVPRKPPARGLRLLDLLARQAGDLIERAMYREQLETLVSERTRELEEKNRALSKQAETVHELSANLLHAQDEERRRIARDLHDTTAQEIG